MRCLDLALVCVIGAACAAAPADPALPHLHEAEAALAEGSPVAAAESYQRALDAAPGDLRALRGLLEAQLTARNSDAALAALGALEARTPERVDPCPVLALAVDGFAASRERLARRAVAVGCLGAPGWLARVLTSKAVAEDRAAAVAFVLEAIELDPNYAAAYYNRGNVYYNLGQHAKAKTDLDKACSLSSYYCANPP